MSHLRHGGKQPQSSTELAGKQASKRSPWGEELNYDAREFACPTVCKHSSYTLPLLIVSTAQVQRGPRFKMTQYSGF